MSIGFLEILQTMVNEQFLKTAFWQIIVFIPRNSLFFFLKRPYFDLIRKAEMLEENSFWNPVAEGCYLVLFYTLSKLEYGRGKGGRL